MIPSPTFSPRWSYYKEMVSFATCQLPIQPLLREQVMCCSCSAQYSSFHLRSASLASCLLVWTHFLYLPLSPLQLLIFYRSCQSALKFTQLSPNLGKGKHTHTHTHTHTAKQSLLSYISKELHTLLPRPSSQAASYLHGLHNLNKLLWTKCLTYTKSQ